MRKSAVFVQAFYFTQNNGDRRLVFDLAQGDDQSAQTAHAHPELTHAGVIPTLVPLPPVDHLHQRRQRFLPPVQPQNECGILAPPLIGIMLQGLQKNRDAHLGILHDDRRGIKIRRSSCSSLSDDLRGQGERIGVLKHLSV